MLRRKLWRTAIAYRVQFISMILMMTLGIGIFVGFNAEWVTIRDDTHSFFEDSGFADFRIVDEEGLTEKEAKKIRDIKGVEGVSRYLSVNADVKDSSNQLALTVTESADTSGFVLMDGEKYDKSDPEGMWLMDKYAELNDISIGDELCVSFEGMKFSGKIRGLIESGEYLICVRDESQVMPDFNKFGYVYVTPAMLKRVIGEKVREGFPVPDEEIISNAVSEAYDHAYPQINVRTTMEKDAFQEAADDALGRTLLVLSKDEVVSYAEAKGEMNEGKTMGSLLPVLFLVIAVLTMITTMNRIAISEKTQIGTLKALGFRDKRILRHYTSYAAVIAVIGAVLGIILGYWFCSLVMSQNGMMGTYFTMPDWTIRIPLWIWAITLILVILTILVGYLSVKKLLQGTASEALRPYTPKHIHRIALERTSLWNKLRFGARWNLRDIFRHGARSAMSFIGTFGCMLLLVASLGMNETMDVFLDTFYDKTTVYSSRVYVSADAANDDALKLAAKLDGDYSASVSSKVGDKPISVDIYNITHGTYQFIDEKSHIIELPDEGALICIRLADEFDVKAGDTVEIEPYGTSESYRIRISGINRSLTESISLSEDYARSLGITGSDAYKISNIYTMTSKDDIRSDSIISNTQSKQDIIDSFDTFMDIFNFFVIALIVGSVLLCLIVLYNLGVMSYMERYREMATLKVLGFRNKAIGRLLISQNLWISATGTLLGIPAGILALKALMKMLASEYEMNVVVGPSSVLLCTALNLGVSAFVGLLIARKNRHIDMVEALKGTE